jgi:phosphate:Na+ symporter
MNRNESDTINSLFKCFADIERMGDHAMNMIEYAQEGQNKLSDSSFLKEELQKLETLLQTNYELLYAYNASDNNNDEKISAVEDQIDQLTAQYRENQIMRLSEKIVSSHDTVIYSEIMTDIERISDHMMNIMEECKRNNFFFNEELFETKAASF